MKAKLIIGAEFTRRLGKGLKHQLLPVEEPPPDRLKAALERLTMLAEAALRQLDRPPSPAPLSRMKPNLP